MAAVLLSRLAGLSAVTVARRSTLAVHLPVATYFSIPTPSWKEADVVALATGGPTDRADRNRRGVQLGRPLSGDEKVAVGLARRHGYLTMTRRIGQEACNAFYQHCWAVGRPYIALGTYGDRVVVDLSPVVGLGGKRNDSKLAAAIARTKSLIDAHWVPMLGLAPGVTPVVSPDVLKAAINSHKDGSNETKEAGTVSDSFHVLTHQRQHAIIVARDIVKTHIAANPETKSAKQVAEARAASTAARTARRELRMRNKLRKIAADPVAMRRFKPGALDGFLRRDAQKQTEGVAPESLPVEWIWHPLAKSK